MKGSGEGKLESPGGELEDGELLAERLARGPLAPEEALRYAIGIGIELKRAHSRGLVHGALYPGAIRIDAAGACVLQPPRGPDAASAPYRSPQQVRGAPPALLDDVFAYGAILYEMASGRRAFPGEGEALDRAIMESAAAALDGKSPLLAAMEHVIAGCLHKDPARRRQRIQNAVSELRLAGHAAARSARTTRAKPLPLPSGPPPLRRRLAMLGLGLLALAATVMAAVLYFHRPPSAPDLLFSVPPPDSATYPGMPSISPNGRYLAFPAAGPGGRRMLWLQPLDEPNATPVPATDGASAPFWSPDSGSIAFFAFGFLKKVRIEGGPVETICPTESIAGGGAWSPDGTILFAPGLAGGLYRVPAAGGPPRRVTALNSSKHESAHLWPQFLPDGAHFLYFARGGDSSGIYLGSLDRPAGRFLFASETNAVYCAGGNSRGNGYLLSVDGAGLNARAFNLSHLAVEGDPIPVAKDVGSVQSRSLAPVSVSTAGILAYRPIGPPARRMVWMDRSGRETAAAIEGGRWGPPRISPDGTRAVVARADGETADLWMLDTSGRATRFTSTPFHEGSPVWSPDGSRTAFFSYRDGAYAICFKPANPAATPEPVLRSPLPKYPTDWSRDGRYLLFGVLAAGTKSDLWVLSVADRRAAPILASIYNEGYGALSPDTNWLAYQSDESGQNEVYVQAFDHASPGARRRWQVSQGGGLPRWRGDGREIFFMTPDGRIMAATVRPGQATFSCDVPHTLFRTPLIPQTWNLYDVSPDGQHFLLNLPQEWPRTSSITVRTNWSARLKRY